MPKNKPLLSKKKKKKKVFLQIYFFLPMGTLKFFLNKKKVFLQLYILFLFFTYGYLKIFLVNKKK